MRFLHELLGWAWIINFIFGRSFDLCTVQFYCIRAAFEKNFQHNAHNILYGNDRYKTLDFAQSTRRLLLNSTLSVHQIGGSDLCALSITVSGSFGKKVN